MNAWRLKEIVKKCQEKRGDILNSRSHQIHRNLRAGLQDCWRGRNGGTRNVQDRDQLVLVDSGLHE